MAGERLVFLCYVVVVVLASPAADEPPHQEALAQIFRVHHSSATKLNALSAVIHPGKVDVEYLLAGALLRVVFGVLVDRLKPKLAGAIGQVIVITGLSLAWIIGIDSYEGALTLGLVPARPLWAVAFVVLGALIMGGLGLLAGIIAQKFDQMAAITNFIVTPLSFLSGTFYSVEALPSPSAPCRTGTRSST